MKYTFAAAILIFLSVGLAQEIPTSDPIVRPRNAEESSSFMGDPDQLDPLPVNRENLKEDEEPVLDDIRQVLNAPAVKKKTKATEPSAQPTETNLTNEAPVKKTTPPKKKVSKKSSAKKQSSSQAASAADLTADDPDLKLEKKFNQIYKRFNAEPTSIEMWDSKTAGRTANTYTVQKGDTLWSVSETLFGDPTFWPKIWSLNRARIENPHFIYPGDQVLFYAGTELDTPALAVSKEGATDSVGVSRADKNAVLDDDSDSGVKSARRQSSGLSLIPDSLPLHRNDSYFLPPQLLTVDLKNLAVPAEIITSDILLTDKEIQSEAELTIDELRKGRCGGDHILKVALKNTEGELGLYEPLETLKTESGDIFSYRQVGTVTVLSADRIRIKDCASVLSKDLVFVSPSLISGLRSTKASQQPTATLIGGPGIGTQKIFSSKQLAYLNLGSQNAEIGQTLMIKSQLTEKPSGAVRIVDKFGSFGIGVITEVGELVEIGDELLPQ